MRRCSSEAKYITGTVVVDGLTVNCVSGGGD